jgi:DNA primase
MPISWDELPTLISANGFTTNNAAARLLQSPEDPWREYYKTEQSLTKSMISQFT